MTEISPTLPSSPATPAEPAVAEPLRGMVMGDAAFTARPSHGLPGVLFIVFSYLMAAGSGLSAILFAVSGVGTGTSLVTGLVWAVLQWRLAREVRRFSRWGWYGAMAELGVAAATKLVWVFFLWEMAFLFVVLLAVDAFLLRYFWRRRVQFDIGFGG